jgi:hypothetical protein
VNLLFLAALATGIFSLLFWGIRTLPGERWQMLAAVPIAKAADGSWRGLNLTFYGLFSATGTTFGIWILLLLLSSIQVPAMVGGALVLLVLVVCVPASRIVARVVEGKRNTFTIAGAAFVAALVLPWIALVLCSQLHLAAPPLAILGAAGVGYAFGESMGRLACLSFGCCYGMPLRSARPFLVRIFQKHNLVLQGATKKAAYASGLAGEPLIPVQAISSLLFAIAGLTGCALFLAGRYRATLLVTSLTVWGWRACSEWLRADHRGHSRISSYQVMSVVAALYSTAVAFTFSSPASALPNLRSALAQTNTALTLAAMQLLWIALFLYYGRSRVTASTLSFHVVASQV